MARNVISTAKMKKLASLAAGLDKPRGNKRLKQVVNRLLFDLFKAIDDLDITMDEFWAAVAYLGSSGKTNELGLLVPGVAIEHFLDLRLDEAEKQAGLAGGTPRTIEGPLYVPGAPVARVEARLDDGTEEGEVLFVEGQVKDTKGKPVGGAIVEVWHANTKGFYSFFGPPQSPYNLRRTIHTDAQGRYRLRTIMPLGYGCPPGGDTDTLMRKLGRHGQRPAHVHFFVSAKGFRHLTTQFNIAGDKYLYDDFAFGTRKDLVPAVTRVKDAREIKALGLEKAFARIQFDFVVVKDKKSAPPTIVHREHAPGA